MTDCTCVFKDGHLLHGTDVKPTCRVLHELELAVAHVLFTTMFRAEYDAARQAYDDHIINAVQKAVEDTRR